MCDRETKNRFNAGYVMQAVILATIGWGSLQLIDIRDKTLAADIIHNQIPAGFFTQGRWGLADELRSQTAHRAEMDLLDKKISILELQIKSHNEESLVWKDRIKDLTRAVERLTHGT